MAYDYDAQIKRLTENPEDIEQEWRKAKGLFQFLANKKLRGRYVTRPYTNCGCPTIILFDPSSHVFIDGKPDYELTMAVRTDPRLSAAFVSDISPEQFPALKEWQQFMDDMGRE